jgi:phage-related minor tail protein
LIEHVWDELREKFFHNRVFKSLNALGEHLAMALKTLECESSMVGSIVFLAVDRWYIYDSIYELEIESVESTTTMKDFFGLSASQAAVVKAGVAGASILQPTVQTIGQGVVNSAVAHAAGCGWHACCTGCMCWPPTC